MRPEPPPPDPGRDQDSAPASAGPMPDEAAGWRLLPSGADWMDGEQWRACLASRSAADEPDDPDRYEDPDCGAPPGLDDAELAALIAGARELSADEGRAMAHAARLGSLGALAAIGATLGRREPDLPVQRGSTAQTITTHVPVCFQAQNHDHGSKWALFAQNDPRS